MNKKHVSLRLPARITAAMLVLILVLTGSLGTALARPVAVGDPTTVVPSLSVTSVVMKGTVSSVTITVRDATSFSSSVSASWLSRTVKGDRITVTTKVNEGSGNRYGYLNVTADGRSLQCLIIQRPMIRTYTSSGGTEVHSHRFEGTNDSKTFYVRAVGTVTAKPNNTYSWLHVSVSGNQVTIKVDINYTGAQRSAVVEISDGVDVKNFGVYQKMFLPDIHGYGYLFGTPTPTSALIKAYKSFYNGKVAAAIEADFNNAGSCALYHSPEPFGNGLKNNQKSTNATNYFYQFIKAACNYYGIAIPREYAVADALTLYSLGYDPAQFSTLYGGYDFKNDCMIINLTSIGNDGTTMTIAEAILHELRHKWQYKKARFNNGRAEYIVHYGALHYTNANDTKQIAEVDARTFASKMIEELNKKMN